MERVHVKTKVVKIIPPKSTKTISIKINKSKSDISKEKLNLLFKDL